MKKKGQLSTILLLLIFFAGLSLLLYPSVANYWNSIHQSRAVTSYEEVISKMSDEESQRLWQEACDYNADIRSRGISPDLSQEERHRYETTLDVSGTGIMGHIEIEKIGVSLPIYHGTDDDILQVAVGHLEWSALPVGGEGTHCVLSGHRGLPSAKLFTNLDRLVEGDLFEIHLLDKILTYEVDQIRIVKPNEVNNLGAEEGKDYCTLVTCTPYGINTHRLLVRGVRVDNVAHKTIFVPNDTYRINPLLVALVFAVPLLLILLVEMLIRYRRKKK